MLRIDRRCFCIVGLILSGHLAITGSFVDVYLNKWTFSRKVLVSFWFDRDNRCGRVEASALVS